MCEIKAINNRKQKKSTKIIALFAGVVLLVLGIYISSIYGVICGILLLASGALSKRTIINEDGILVIYDAIVYKYKEVWKFEDIKELHRENIAGTDNTALHFMKDIMSKRVLLTAEDAEKVLQLANEANSKMHVDDAYYSR